MKRLKPAYGFLPATFELLEKRSKEMESADRHVNLGMLTPEELKDRPGDHALVFMFQPWENAWFQTIGAFLSKGAVKGPILGKLCLEATGLLEKAGFPVDMWVCDGASWNRNMWTEMSLKNPFSSRKKRKDTVDITLVTPDGTVKFSHWEALWQADNAREKPI
ncbi:hypothetical protein FOCC_FOCC006464 [Frankliniella occidentalis]|nr:hypothetical protein FOCC_FOCC006464 [Frankliniella occidentalis]